MYYSQHGEDFLLDKIFTGKSDGYFVEVGCVDGKRFSNTLHFEEVGWKGLNIEAHASYIPLLEKNRKDSTVIHAAVYAEDGGDITFFADRRGSLSTLDKSREIELRRDYAEYFSGFEEQKVPRRTLTSIFNEVGVTHIDFLSLDIEGGEIDALKGLDFTQYKPTVLVIEFDSLRKLRQLDSLLNVHGYERGLVLMNNAYYSTQTELLAPVQGVVVNDLTLTHTGNPFDKESDSTKIVTVDTTKIQLLRTYFAFVKKAVFHAIKDIIKKYD